MILRIKKVVVTSNSSIQSLSSIFVENLQKYVPYKDPAGASEELKLNNQNEREKIKREIGILQDILRTYGHVLIDEVDSILDIMASHRFSVGQRQKLESTIINAATGLYRLLAEDRDIQNKIKIPFIEDSGPRSCSF